MPDESHQPKTRLAPTPSGFLHLGNVLSFALTAFLAKKAGAKILLRIDDLDRTRANALYIQDIFQTLEFLKIPWQEGPRSEAEFEEAFSQVHRLEKYNHALQQLADNGKVFACSCSRKQLTGEIYGCRCRDKNIPLDTENVNWRFITDNEKEISVKEYNDSTITAALPKEMQNFIVKKRDGFPAYQLTSVIDDLFYKVTFIVRGADLWPSTLGQLQLAAALGESSFNEITFFHHPLLSGPAGEKLSKSAGATSVNYLRKNGKIPSDVYTTIAQMFGSDKVVSYFEELGNLLWAIVSPRPNPTAPGH